jgi:glutamine synthetase
MATMLGIVDVNGCLRGKTYSQAAFEAIRAKGGVPLTDLMLAVDPADQPITTFTRFGIRAGSGDVLIRPLESTRRALPWNEAVALCLADVFWRDGTPCELSSRRVLEHALEALEADSLRAVAAFEYEVRLHVLADGAPLTGAQSYSIAGAERFAEFGAKLVAACEQLEIQIDALHTEAGPGLVEINCAHADALRAADDAIVLRHAVREVARSVGLEASFLAKPVAEEEGSSGHIHLSLWTGERNALAEAEEEPGPRLRHAVGGLLAHLPAASLLMNPTINSYKRLVPDFFAPVNRSWGTENRTAAVRAIVAGDATRVEVRRPGADANPYLALAAIVVAAREGLRAELEPPPPIVGDAWSASGEEAEPLPASLESALAAFAADPGFRQGLGEEFSEYFAATREWELRAWQRVVTEWEIARYRPIA